MHTIYFINIVTNIMIFQKLVKKKKTGLFVKTKRKMRDK